MPFKYLKPTLISVQILAIFILNYLIFRFNSYATFRDYTSVRNQDFSINNINPLSNLYEYIQNNLLHNLDLSQISTINFTLQFSFGFIVTFISVWYLIQIVSSKTDLKDQAKPYFNYLLTLFLTFLTVYNPFNLERFFMGQDRIILGNFFILPYLVLAIAFTISLYQPNIHKTTKQIKLVGMALIACILASFNLHSLIIITVLSLVFGLVFLKKSKLLLVVFLINLTLVVFSLALNYNLLSFNSNNYYFSQVFNNQASTNSQIEAFSLKNQNTSELVTKGLIGGSSWNTPGFVELDQITFQLAEFGNFALYIDDGWAIGFFVFLVLNFLIAVYFLIKTSLPQSKFLWLKIGILALLPFLGLFFSFGYSLPITKNINQFIYLIPGSYIFREPGKAYYLFYIVMILGVVFTTSQIKPKWLKKANLSLIGLYALSAMIPFTLISNNLNYIMVPSIFDYAFEICKNRNLVYLPDKTYIVPSYSKTFIPNPLQATKSTDCKIRKPGITSLMSYADPSTPQVLQLEITENGQFIADALRTYKNNLPQAQNGVLSVDVTGQEKNAKQLIAKLRQNNIQLLLVDPSKIDNGFNLINDLTVYSKLLKTESDIYLFEL